MSLDLEIQRAVAKFRWHRAFATEYVMNKEYKGMSHERAYAYALSSPYINNRYKPDDALEEVRDQVLAGAALRIVTMPEYGLVVHNSVTNRG